MCEINSFENQSDSAWHFRRAFARPRETVHIKHISFHMHNQSILSMQDYGGFRNRNDDARAMLHESISTDSPFNCISDDDWCRHSLNAEHIMTACVSVIVCVWERERQSHSHSLQASRRHCNIVKCHLIATINITCLCLFKHMALLRAFQPTSTE